MTNCKDTDIIRHKTPWSRARRTGIVRLLLLALAVLFVLGCQRCDDRPATITCSDIVMLIEPGTTVPLLNPCDHSGRWRGAPDFDGFQLCLTDEQRTFFAASGPPSITTTRVNGEATRSISVSADSPRFYSLDIPFVYGLGVQSGTGSFILSVAPHLTLQVTASPSNIALGQTSQLVATAGGGIPPYFYSWVPTTGLDDPDIAAPIASPVATTEYRVRVTDSGGQELIGSATISVGMELTVTANPPGIAVGDASVLLASPRGGTPPYTFEWTPSDTLDDATVQNPTATPTATTTYNVTVRDSLGATRSGSATVFVAAEHLAVVPSATPSTIQAGGTSQLDAAVTGGTPPYGYSWEPSNSLSNPTIRNPVASPASTETYCVHVTDALGRTTSQCVTVHVAQQPPLTASFIFNVLCCPTLNLDASASTGNIVSYTWDLSWTTSSPDRVTSSPTTSFVIREFDRGTITLTVTDASGRTATTSRNF